MNKTKSKSPRCTILVPLVIFLMIFLGWYHKDSDIWNSNQFFGRLDDSMREQFIQERLAEAEIIWRQGIATRELVEIESPISPDNPWGHVHYRTIWDFFYPTFNCPHMVERLGRTGDGGKWICGVSHLAKLADNCVMYSFGISTDSSFEEDILNRTGCLVYAYDHTVNADQVAILKSYPERTTFYKQGLGGTNTVNLKTLKTEMDRHGHNFIDILKIDIEGAEYSTIPQILQDFPHQLPIGQLLIEIHLDLFPQKDLYKMLKGWWVPLEKAGLRPYRTEPNVFPNLIGVTRFPTYYEISFMNTQVDNILLHAYNGRNK